MDTHILQVDRKTYSWERQTWKRNLFHGDEQVLFLARWPENDSKRPTLLKAVRGVGYLCLASDKHGLAAGGRRLVHATRRGRERGQDSHSYYHQHSKRAFWHVTSLRSCL